MRRAAMMALLFLLAGCAQEKAPEPFPEEKAAAWAQRFAAHDAEGVAAFYTEDAVLLPPDLEPVSGRASIQEFFARTNPEGAASVEFATIETFMFGNHAWRQGSFRVEGPGDGGRASGKFAELWKKVDGEWLIHRDIWNSNAPPPAAAAPDAAPDEPA